MRHNPKDYCLGSFLNLIGFMGDCMTLSEGLLSLGSSLQQWQKITMSKNLLLSSHSATITMPLSVLRPHSRQGKRTRRTLDWSFIWPDIPLSCETWYHDMYLVELLKLITIWPSKLPGVCVLIIIIASKMEGKLGAYAFFPLLVGIIWKHNPIWRMKRNYSLKKNSFVSFVKQILISKKHNCH